MLTGNGNGNAAILVEHISLNPLVEWARRNIYEGHTDILLWSMFRLSNFSSWIRVKLSLFQVDIKPQSVFFFDFGFEISWIHLISWIRVMLQGQQNLLSMNSDFITLVYYTISGKCKFIFHYTWRVQINFQLSRNSVNSYFAYTWIVKCSMHSAIEYLNYPWTVNSTICVQLGKLV